MASNYSEYSRKRSIARKRAERLAEAGLSKLITFPTVKELKAKGISAEQAIKQVERYLDAPTQTRQYRRMDEQQRPVFIQAGAEVIVTEKEKEKTERKRAQARERSRRYRERKKAIYSEFDTNELGMLKGARTLGLRIPPSMAKAYIEYMEYRFDYGNSQIKYRMATYTEDFVELLVKRGKKDITATMRDFNLFMKDRKALIMQERKKKKNKGKKTGKKEELNEYGYTGEEVDKLFHDFIYS